MTLQLKVTLMWINYKISKEAMQENKGDPRALPASLCYWESSRESSWLSSLHWIRTYWVNRPGNSQLPTRFFIKPGKRQHLPKKTSPLLDKEILTMAKLPPFKYIFPTSVIGQAWPLPINHHPPVTFFCKFFDKFMIYPNYCKCFI